MMNMPRGSHFSTKSLGKMCTQAFDDFGFESQKKTYVLPIVTYFSKQSSLYYLQSIV